MKKLFHGIMVGLGASAAALALWLGGVLDRWEYLTWTFRVGAFAPRDLPSDKVRLVLIDQASLDWGKDEMGLSWPWPREVYVPLLDFCRRAGAKAVAFDMIFSEPSALGVADDEALGAAIAATPAFAIGIVLGREAGVTTAWPAALPSPPLAVEGFNGWLETVNAGRLKAPRALFPIPEVASNAAWFANVMDLPDRDGVYRRATFFRVFDGRTVPSLGLAAYLAACAPDERPALRIEKGWLNLGTRRIPIDDDGRAILRFRGRTGLHTSYSAAAVIQSELRLKEGGEPVLSPDVFKDSYVFLGSSAPGLYDLRPTPVSRVYPGVGIQATVLDNLLTLLFLRDAPKAPAAAATVLFGLVAGILVALSRKAWHSVAAFVVCLPLPVLAGFAGYAAGFWWPIVVGESAVVLALVGGVVVNYATEGRQKAFIKSAFKFYLGPEVIEEILADPSRLKLGGEKRELTIFFSDIEKFSSFSEKLDPAALTALLNEYLTEMGGIIRDEGGYLDKYIGDAIVAFWNAPVAQPDHAARACRAALRCQRRLADLREDLRKRTGATVKMRIGINTGEVTVGNMGSRDRFNYTILGDAANLASRLEGANKAFGTYFMVSEATWTKTGGGLVGRELGQIRVVGREKPVRVFEPVGLQGDPVPPPAAAFGEGLALVGAARYTDALKVFERFPDDSVCRVYADRCRYLLAHPTESWDGIWNLAEKG